MKDKDLKKRIKNYINQKHFSYSMHITNKMLYEATIFVRGFESCFKNFFEQPIKEKEIQEMLVNEGVIFVIEEINKHINKN